MAPTQQQAKSMKAAQLAGKSKSKKKSSKKSSLTTGAPSTKARVQRYLKSTEPQVREGAKSTLLLRGIKTNEGLNVLLKDLRACAAPHAKLLSKKNQIVPFENGGGGADSDRSIEFLTTKNDCSLFALASTNKKRPNRLVIGRTFDRQILDMVELRIHRFKSMNDYGGTVPKKRIGSKPLMLFVGDVWTSSNLHSGDYRNLQNLLVDFYRGDVVDKFVLSGIDHVIVFTAAENPNSTVGGIGNNPITIHQRTYFCKLKKNPNAASATGGAPPPVPFLESCGPDLDYVLGRTRWCVDRDVYRASRKVPQSLKPKKKKNQSTNAFGETVGRLHVTKQNIDSGTTGRKVKALRRAEKIAKQEEMDAVENELRMEEEQMKNEL